MVVGGGIYNSFSSLFSEQLPTAKYPKERFRILFRGTVVDSYSKWATIFIKYAKTHIFFHDFFNERKKDISKNPDEART